MLLFAVTFVRVVLASVALPAGNGKFLRPEHPSLSVDHPRQARAPPIGVLVSKDVAVGCRWAGGERFSVQRLFCVNDVNWHWGFAEQVDSPKPSQAALVTGEPGEHWGKIRSAEGDSCSWALATKRRVIGC